MLPRMVLSRSPGSLVAALGRPALAARLATRPASLVATSQLALAARAYSAAAKLKTEEDDFFAGAPERAEPVGAAAASGKPVAKARKVHSVIPEDGFFAPELAKEHNGKAAASQAPPTETHEGPVTKQVPFSALKGRVLPQTLKAVSFKPFNLEAMSEVQKRVLGKMPELAGGTVDNELLMNETPEEKDAREVREKKGREDLLVKAKTGTGKTLAFLMPSIDARIHTIDKLVAEPDADGEVPTLSVQGLKRRDLPRSHVGTLVISPTRELATQIANEALKLQTWYKEMQVQLLVGGGSRREQMKNWASVRKGRKDIVVATPGRLVDLLDEPKVADAIANTDILVLDEADTLLEMGFSQALERIVEALPKERQTFLFSATVSPQIERIARNFLKPNHSLIDCVPKNESNVHLHIPQHAIVLNSPEEQLPTIARLIAQDQLAHPNDSKIILFLPTTKQTMLFATLMREMAETMPSGLSVHEIHSRLDQDRRSRANERFRRDKRASILVTSDVSARGVDYPGVTRVIQVGIPQSTDQYVHRVGRTGRGSQKTGHGDIVLLPFESGFVNELEKMKVPLTRLEPKDIIAEVDELAETDHRAQSRIATIDSKAAEIPPMLDPEAITEVFTSLIGYYVAKSDVLHRSPHEIYRGLQGWTTGAIGLPEPPYLSQSFLTKMGINPERERRSGGRGGGGGGGHRKTFGLRRNDDGDRDGGFGGRSNSGFGGRSNGGFGGRRNDGDREGGFRPRFNNGDRDGGFRPRRNDRTEGDRDGGFRPRRFNNEDAFRSRGRPSDF